MTLDKQELKQVREYVIRILPELLREDAEIATTIEGILAQHFPRRDEFARLLDELRLLREEMERRFEQVEQRLDLQREEMERRFEQVEQRLDLQREEMEQRFDLQHQEMLELRRDVAQLQHGQEIILKRMDGQEAWLRLVIGDLRAEKGKSLEDMFAAALRYGLKNPDITPETLQLRQKLVDTEGRAFKPGFETEVDLIAENGRLTVFEVKATAKPGDVGIFALKVELVAAQNPDKQVEGVFISLAAPAEVRRRCSEYGLTLVD